MAECDWIVTLRLRERVHTSTPGRGSPLMCERGFYQEIKSSANLHAREAS
jgi:hypothetical protein